VRETVDVVLCEIGVDVFDARDRVDVRAFAAE
jgi:hypothetical protein